MKIKDKRLKKLIDVFDIECPARKCYWPREDPGVFTVGVGYRHRSDDWLCGNREIRGCPSPIPEPQKKRKGGGKR